MNKASDTMTYRIDIQPTSGGYYAWVTVGYTSKRLALGVGVTPLAAANDARREMRIISGMEAREM